ncbi:MAG: hypothetical protein JO015_08700 [Verrucomicrobia bacterium]|nr:hypothetical protein [Verrucomicrobiota bacterium]
MLLAASTNSGTPSAGFLDPQAILTSVGTLAGQLESVSYLIAFVLLVTGALDGFLKPAQLLRFLQHLARLVCLVTVIVAQTAIHTLLQQMVDGIANQTVSLTVQDYASAYKTVNVNARLDEAVLQAIIDSKVNPADHPGANQPAQSSGWFGGLLKEAGDLIKLVSGRMFHHVVFALVCTALRICALVVALTDFLQKLILILLGIWYPIGIAQLSVSGLKSVGTHFISTYVGVHVWPIGMIFVNLVACGLLAGVTAVQPGQIVALLMMLVYVFPILIWLLVGSFIAPVFAQKLVTHGGSALQAMTGAMVATTSAVTARLVSGAAQGLGSMVSGHGGAQGPGPSRREGGDFLRDRGGIPELGGSGATGQPVPSGWSGPSLGQSARGMLGLGLNGVSAASDRLGRLGEALGAMTSEAGDYGRHTVYSVEDLLKPARTRNSSERARRYLDSRYEQRGY